MTLDSAWRQYRHNSREQTNAEQKLAGARNVWMHTLIEQMEERLEEAREAGLDVTDAAVLWRMGVPCVCCLTIVTADHKGKHKLFAGGQNSPSIYADGCKEPPVDPLADDVTMPTWPAMPQPKPEGD